MMDVSERVDRTRLVFYGAGTVFALGLWAYIFGAVSPASADASASQWDFVSTLPILFSIASLAVLNAFTDRTALHNDGSTDFFAGGGISRPARVFVFTMLVLSLMGVAAGALMGIFKYGPDGSNHLAWGVFGGCSLITMSSMMVFWFRKIEPSYF
jgi:Uncharacterised protein family (UPF0220)